MTKIYYDAVNNFEIHDFSDKKDISQLLTEFNCVNLVDVTKEREDQNIISESVALKNAAKEKLISDKIREQAIEALKLEGKLDTNGEIKE